MDELYLENLDEYINDNNRVISYKWLSRSLGVHVNQAKQMLYAFVQQQRNNKDNDAISVTYLVTGSYKSSNDPEITAHKVSITPEERLEVTKSKFSQVSSCHIYSVQKSQLKDSNVLYTADYDQLVENVFTSNKYSAITCTRSKLRSDSELNERNNSGGEAYAPSYTPKAASSARNGTAKSKTGSIGAMFNKASKTQTSNKGNDSSKQAEKTVEKEVKSKPVDKKPLGGLASAFAKQAAKPKVEKVAEPTEPVPKKDSEDSKKVAPTKEISKKKKKNADDEDERKSKRRRIKVIESSSEESDVEEMPPSPPREPTPEPEPISVDSEPEVEDAKLEKPKETEKKVQSPDTIKKTGKKGRVQKRKLVPKTYLDEDGFMVTEKVYECYSTDASEDDEKPPPPPPTTKNDPKPKPEQKTSKKKASPNKNTGSKQTSLMNFFKKK